MSVSSLLSATDSDSNLKNRFGALHDALAEVDADWVSNGDVNDINFSVRPPTSDILTEHIPPNDSNQHQFQSESTHSESFTSE